MTAAALLSSQDGNPKVDKKKPKEHLPHEFMWNVAEGKSTGPGFAHPMKWDAFYNKTIQEHMFKK